MLLGPERCEARCRPAIHSPDWRSRPKVEGLSVGLAWRGEYRTEHPLFKSAAAACTPRGPYPAAPNGFVAPGKLSSGQFSAENGRQPRTMKAGEDPVSHRACRARCARRLSSHLVRGARGACARGARAIQRCARDTYCGGVLCDNGELRVTDTGCSYNRINHLASAESLPCSFAARRTEAAAACGG